MDKRATDAIEIYSRTRCRRQEDGIVFVLCTFFPFLSPPVSLSSRSPWLRLSDCNPDPEPSSSPSTLAPPCNFQEESSTSLSSLVSLHHYLSLSQPLPLPSTAAAGDGAVTLKDRLTLRHQIHLTQCCSRSAGTRV